MFQSKFETVFLSSIDDSVFYVRMRAVEVLRKVAKIFGSTWTVEHLLPKILEHYNADTGFVMRVTVIRTMHKLADVLSPQQTKNRSCSLKLHFNSCFAKYIKIVICDRTILSDS